jgi:hypothetical protein
VQVQSERFAQAVFFDVDGLVADDAYFHLAPGQRQRTHLRAIKGARLSESLSGCVRALNLDAMVVIQMADEWSEGQS